MSTKTRRWLKWSIAGGALILLALGLWIGHAQGWLPPVETWLQGKFSKAHVATPTGREMEGMPGMQMDEQSESMQTGSDVPGYAPVVIEPGIQQQIGVTVGEVEQEPLLMSVKAVGTVQPNETKTARVHLRANGWVDELFVNFTGQDVQKGDPLLAIYSPEFLTSQEEYLIARKAEGESALGKSRRSLAKDALRKLKLLGVPAEEIRELEESGQSRVNLKLKSPIQGTVLEKNVLEGDYLTPERELYVVSDLSTVWVQAKIYQYELPHVEMGTPAAVTVPGLPSHRFEGKVVFIQPTVEAATRTVQVRIELANPDGLLKPDMFVEVEIEHPMGEGLLVPASAVFRTGERDLVFRAAESDRRFVPAEVEISPMKFAGERYHVLKGISAGDRIITSANFLIDSESRLRSGGGGMMPGMEGMKMDMPGMEGMDHSKMKH